MSSSGEQSTGDPKKKAAAFFAGLSSSQLFILTISSGNFSVGRFMLPENLVGIYINRIVIAYRITAFIGTVLFQLWVLIGKDNYRNHFPVASSVSICLYCLSYILMFLAYYNGGQRGHIMYYYCGIIFSAFVYGSDNILLTNVAVGEIDYYVGSSQLISILISIYQTSFIYFAMRLGVTKIEFKLIIGQMIFAIILSGVSAILWICAYWDKTSGGGADTSEGFYGFKNAWSPIFMAAMGFGLQCLVYSAIAPYKIIGMAKGYKIDLAVLATSSIPSLTLLFLSRNKMGAKVQWKDAKSGWHYAWLFILLQVTLVVLFFLSLHYHDWPLSRVMRSNIWVMGVMTVAFGICVQAGWGIGMNGAPMQDGGGRNPKMDSLNTWTYTTFQLMFAFLGDGYLSTYRVYEKDKDNWPTKHYGTLRAFWFWTWSAIKYACKKARHAYTSDLRGVILGKKDYLFIVYTDG